MAVDGDSFWCGILGWPVSHSFSPAIHNAAFEARGLNGVYLPFPVERPGRFLKQTLLAAANFRGLSVTIPHKRWAARIADIRDDLAEACDAANTLVPTPDGLSAYNTDGPGAIAALRRHAELAGKRHLLIGYGGSAAAIAHTLLLDTKPAAVLVAGRNPRRRGQFAEALANSPAAKKTLIRSVEWSEVEAEDFDTIIHTTPLGMKGQSAELPLPDDLLGRRHLVFDIVYNPATTPLVALAKSRGATCVPGYLMLLCQAVLQFELFTNERAPEAVMERELLRAIRRLS